LSSLKETYSEFSVAPYWWPD